MATKKGNGHDPATQAIVDALQRIEKQIVATNTRLDGTNERLDALRDELHGFREETREELLDLRGLIRGERPGTVETRLAKLEAAVFRPTGT